MQARLQPVHEEGHRPGNAEIDCADDDEDVQRQERLRHDDAAAERQLIHGDERTDGAVLQQRDQRNQQRRQDHAYRLREHDQPYQAIIETASKRRCDLIAMASHGRRGVSALVLGSETSKVLTHSRVPVLVYRFAR